jgi:SNF2 family DNA or RNA helicase
MSKIAYHINKVESEAQKILVINLQAGEISRPLSGAQWKKNASAKEDVLALNFLIEEEIKYQKRLTGKNLNDLSLISSAFHVPFSQTTPALKLLAATGGLYFNQRQIVCDFYGKSEIVYRVEEEQDLIKISVEIKTSLQSFNLSECHFVCPGPPAWFIKDISLKFFPDETPWTTIKKALAGNLKIEDIQEEGEKIIYVGNSQEKLKHSLEPLPLLTLKDQTGAFADLWMSYGEECVPYHEPKKISGERLLKSEANWEKDLLETEFIKKNVGTSHYYCPMDKISKSLGFLLELGWQIKDWKGRRLIPFGKSNFNMEALQNTIQIKGKIKFEDFDVDISQVAGAFNRKEKFLQLTSTTVTLLPSSIENPGLNQLLEESELVGNTLHLKRSQIGILNDLIPEKTDVEMDAELMALRERLQSFEKINVSPPDTSFKGTLRSYQQQGVDWLAFLYDYGFHGILADDMGLGKTVQVLAFLSRLELTAPILIVLPTSLIFNWRKEIERFLPEYSILIHHGATRGQHLAEKPGFQFILTSYTTLRLDLNLFRTIDFQCVILDEAQVIKNANTITAQAVCQLKSKFRLSLTGTPLENHLNELWSHFHFLIPDLFKDAKEFENELLAGASDSRFLKRIKKKIHPFILRRKKEDVAKDLPDKIEQIVWIEMAETQQKLYDSFLSGVRGNLLKKVQSEGVSKHRMEVLEAILRLRQICCHPALVSSLLDETSLCESAKLTALLQDLETVIEEGRKVLVYSQFTSMLQLISKEVKKREWKYVYLDGSTPDREKVVTEFQENPATQLFLISLKAGGIGLNLTAADYVFLYDPWWNEAAENQAIDRVHRIGRKETVFAKRYITVSSIEEKMMTLKAHKRHLISEIFDEEGSPSSVTIEDLAFLLES